MIPKTGTTAREALEAIKRMDSPTITAAWAARALVCHPNLLRWQAHNDPMALGFPVTVMGSRVIIPRRPFIRYLENGIMFDEEEGT